MDERTGARASPLAEAADLLADLVERDVRTICFLRSRRGVELILKFARLRLEDRGRADLAERIAPYRAGYTPAQRREIERRLVEGELLAVVATDALELGIDVGELDAAICVTFPGTVASLRQMWGRAGPAGHRPGACTSREPTPSTSSSAATPRSSSEAAVESAILDHESEEIHLRPPRAPRPTSCRCRPATQEFLGERWEPAAQRLVKMGLLRERAGATCPGARSSRRGGSRCARRRPTRWPWSRRRAAR